MLETLRNSWLRGEIRVTNRTFAWPNGAGFTWESLPKMLSLFLVRMVCERILRVGPVAVVSFTTESAEAG